MSATKTQINDFIETLGTLARNEALKRSKWILPSICTAQSGLETGWGTSLLMTKANAFFGIKWTKGCGFNAYSSKTKEVYSGNEVSEIAAFRAYDTLEDSVKDYYDLLTSLSYYRDMVNNPDYRTAVNGIDDNGDSNITDGLYKYATDPYYQRKVINLIETYDLTRFDVGLVTTSKSESPFIYLPKWVGTGSSIVNALNAIGEDSGFSNRKKIAVANGIANYSGTSSQNMALVNLIKQGKLIKP